MEDSERRAVETEKDFSGELNAKFQSVFTMEITLPLVLAVWDGGEIMKVTKTITRDRDKFVKGSGSGQSA